MPSLPAIPGSEGRRLKAWGFPVPLIGDSKNRHLNAQWKLVFGDGLAALRLSVHSLFATVVAYLLPKYAELITALFAAARCIMSEAEQLSSLIGEIYDAALDPALWPAVLERVCAYVSGCTAVIYSQNAASKSGNRHYSWGDDPEYTQLYFEKYIKMSPFTTAPLLLEVGEIKSCYDLVPYSEVVETRFYKEWMRPQGHLDNIFATLDKSTVSYAALSVIRAEQQGFFDHAARHLMELIVPHVRRSVLIGNVIDLHKADAAALADTFSGLAASVFIVDASARIVHANGSGQAMLADGSLLRLQDRKLAVNDAEAERVLHHCFAAASSGDAAIGVRGVALPLTARDGERYVAHVLPLTSGARRQAGIVYAATTAVFVNKAALDLPSPMETVAKLYRLTPSELRVLSALVEIGGLPAVADVLGISRETAKTHLNNVFAKTGTNRQADLVKLIAGYANPLI